MQSSSWRGSLASLGSGIRCERRSDRPGDDCRLCGGFRVFCRLTRLRRGHSPDKKIAAREALYSDFIAESARLLTGACEHNVTDPQRLIPVYALLAASGSAPLRGSSKRRRRCCGSS